MTDELTAPDRAAERETVDSQTAVPAARNERKRAGRIAILFQDFAAGGTERIMVRLANEWARDRSVAIFCGAASGPALASLSPRVEVIEASPAIPRSPLSRWKLGSRLGGALREWRPDVIVGPGNHVLPIILAIGEAPAPLVCKLSNPINPVGHAAWTSAPFAPLRRWACSPLSRIIAMSPALRDEAAAYLPTANVTVIGEPILPARPVIARRAVGSRRRILFAGRLVAQKRVALALRTLVELPEDMTLTIVGDGPDRSYLQALAQRLGIAGRVTFTGLVPDISPFLTSADLFLLPSRFEGYPAVLIEALAAGLPVVATPCSPAMPEIITDPSFGRIAAADPISLATAVLALGNGPGPNPSKLDALLAPHSLATSANDWLKCLDQVAANGRTRSMISDLPPARSEAPRLRPREHGKTRRSWLDIFRLWWEGLD